jgi:RNA-binding protein YlmH
MNQQKEELFMLRHLEDLRSMAEHRYMVTYSDFLNLNDKNLFRTLNIPEDSYIAFGGYEFAERQVIGFLPDALFYEGIPVEEQQAAFPIHCIRITPKHAKFAEQLSHRDLLGALMNQGIERQLLGDIIVREDEYLIFCMEKIASFLTDQLTRIRHTEVRCTEIPLGEVHYQPKFRLQSAQVASNRLDAIIAEACHLSRQKAADLIRAEKVYVNERIESRGTYALKPQDVVSIRGIGKLQFLSFDGQTKKGKEKITFQWYD